MKTTFDHATPPRVGVLLTNLGTPEAPTPSALRKYLAEFLWDTRVIDTFRPLWWLILNLSILRKRPAQSARLYKNIWTDTGSPLMVTAREQAKLLEKRFVERGDSIDVEIGMRYGAPSIAEGYRRLRERGARRILLLPLYPQYCAATVGSTIDAFSKILLKERWIPDFRVITHYHDRADYIEALARSIKEVHEKGVPDVLVFSFHGIPKRYFESGDPYFCECQKTARLVAERLRLPAEKYRVSFQSRFGPEEWIRPYTDETLVELARSGVKRVDIVAPGFSADCLETLEELAITNRELFESAGGHDPAIQYRYIPALNARADHIEMLLSLVDENLFGWPTRAREKREAEMTARRAKELQASL